MSVEFNFNMWETKFEPVRPADSKAVVPASIVSFFIIFFSFFLLPCQPLHQRLAHVNGLKLPKSHWFNAPKLILNSMPVF